MTRGSSGRGTIGADGGHHETPVVDPGPRGSAGRRLWPGGSRSRAGRGPRAVPDRPVRGAPTRRRDDRHRERARRPDVARPVPPLLEPVGRRGARRHHLDLDEGAGPARRHPLGSRRLREGAAEPAEARSRLSHGGRAAERGGAGAAGLRHGRRGRREGVARGRADPARRREGRPAAALGPRLGRHQHARPGPRLRAVHAHRRRRSRPSVSKLRVYAISDQDDAGPWIRREFPGLRYVATPSTQDGEEYYFATWTGISGDRFYRNAPGADFTTFTDEWVNANVRSKGPLGALYPFPCCIHEGDTPTFLGLIDNGLASAMSPAYGGWGGRYVWRQPSGETRPFWTQGGDSYPGERQLPRHGDRRRRARRTRPTRPRSGGGGRRSRTTSPRAWTGRSRTRARRTTTRGSW